MVSVEFILVKTINRNEWELEIRRYLNLRRHFFRISNALDGILKVKYTYPKAVQKLTSNKFYRIVSKTPYGAILQTKFSIADDYTASIEIPTGKLIQKYDCRILVDNFEEDRLIVNVYKKEGPLYMFTTFTFSPNFKKDDLIIGSFCIADGMITEHPVSNRFIMKGENLDFIPVKIAKDKMDSMVEDRGFNDLLNKLQQLEEESLKKGRTDNL